MFPDSCGREAGLLQPCADPRATTGLLRRCGCGLRSVHGGWGRNGATHVRLAEVTKDVLEGALHSAWKLRVEKNAATRKRKPSAKKR